MSTGNANNLGSISSEHAVDYSSQRTSRSGAARSKYRRNGTQASCEPCRKRKTRCDHRQPICTPCERRNVASQCLYHPSPLSKTTSRRQRTPAQAESNATRVDDVQPSLPPPSDFNIDARTSITPDAVPTSELYDNDTSNFSTWPFVEADLQTRRSKTFVSRHHELRMHQRHRECIKEILQPLRYWETIKETLRTFLSTRKFSHVPHRAVRQLMDTLPVTVENNKAVYPGGLEAFSRAVLASSSKSVEITGDMDVEAFGNLFSGTNLRIETVGLLYCLSAKLVLYDHHRMEPIDDEFVSEMVYYCQLSLQLARALSQQSNDVILWLGYMQLQLMNFIEGDASLDVWRGTAELTTDMQALKIHREYTHASNRIPMFLSQSRKRIFYTMHYIDKRHASTFLRPPCLPSQYADCKFLLDIPDDALFSPERLKEETSKLSTDGWSNSEVLTVTTASRARFRFSLFLEEIIEINMRPAKQADEEYLRDMSKRLHQCWDELPSFTKYRPECWTTGDTSPQSCMALAMIYLAYQQVDFAIFGILLKANGYIPEEMVMTSWQQLETVLKIVQARNLARIATEDMPAVLLAYGVGSAVILLDVLGDVCAKRRQFPAVITKSALLRNVSVLVSNLEMASNPSESNHAFCASAAKMLSDKLDHALDPQVASGIVNVQPMGSVASGGNVEAGSLFDDEPAFMFEEQAVVSDQSWTNWGLLDADDTYPLTLL